MKPGTPEHAAAVARQIADWKARQKARAKAQEDAKGENQPKKRETIRERRQRNREGIARARAVHGISTIDGVPIQDIDPLNGSPARDPLDKAYLAENEAGEVVAVQPKFDDRRPVHRENVVPHFDTLPTRDQLAELLPVFKPTQDRLRVTNKAGFVYTVGRPGVAMAIKALVMHGTGMSLSKACDRVGVPMMSVLMLTEEGAPLHELYLRAREGCVETRVDHLLDITDGETDAAMANVKSKNIQWYATKIMPRLYGDKPATGSTSSVTINIGVGKRAAKGDVIDAEVLHSRALSGPEQS